MMAPLRGQESEITYSFRGMSSTVLLVGRLLQDCTPQTALSFHKARGALGMDRISNAGAGFFIPRWPSVNEPAFPTGLPRIIQRG